MLFTKLYLEKLNKKFLLLVFENSLVPNFQKITKINRITASITTAAGKGISIIFSTIAVKAALKADLQNKTCFSLSLHCIFFFLAKSFFLILRF